MWQDDEVEEKRNKRSEDTVTAIRFQLEYVQERYGIDLIVLADAGGIALAYAGDAPAAELVAAFAEPLCASNHDVAIEVIQDVMPGAHIDRLHCEQVEFDATPMYLVAFGEADAEARVGFARAKSGIERIYRTTGPAAR